jgi:hypothetical protein
MDIGRHDAWWKNCHLLLGVICHQLVRANWRAICGTAWLDLSNFYWPTVLYSFLSATFRKGEKMC